MTTEPTPQGNLIGYVRVSTAEQNLDMQIEALRRYGVQPGLIFQDKVSGIASKRPGRDAMLRQARAGDTLVVWKLDRISRSLLDLLTLLERLEKDGIAFKSLTDPIDTTGPIGRAVVAIIGAVAQLERDLIVQRTRAGVKRAIERGQKFGQPSKLTPEVRAKIEKWIREDKPVPWMATQIKCHEQTIRRVYTSQVMDAIRQEQPFTLRLHSKDRKHFNK